uniref:RING-type domain-containing protein n=1 Tax=Clastoptera arizonana TaxID=38151 RepID=A0A1B6DS92_9HEMI
MSENIGNSLHCNLKQCRAPIISHCFVTSCSHMFCTKHEWESKNLSIEGRQKCPVCNMELYKELDLIQVNVNPSDNYRAIVLAGLSPDIIFDIASRAISFYNQQVHRDMFLQSSQIKHLATQLALVENNFERMTTKAEEEIQNHSSKVETLENKNRIMAEKLQELNKVLFDRNHVFKNLQVKYENLRMDLEAFKQKQKELVMFKADISPFLSNQQECPTHYFQRVPKQQTPNFQMNFSNNQGARPFFNTTPETPRTKATHFSNIF